MPALANSCMVPKCQASSALNCGRSIWQAICRNVASMEVRCWSATEVQVPAPWNKTVEIRLLKYTALSLADTSGDWNSFFLRLLKASQACEIRKAISCFNPPLCCRYPPRWRYTGTTRNLAAGQSLQCKGTLPPSGPKISERTFLAPGPRTCIMASVLPLVKLGTRARCRHASRRVEAPTCRLPKREDPSGLVRNMTRSSIQVASETPRLESGRASSGPILLSISAHHGICAITPASCSSFRTCCNTLANKKEKTRSESESPGRDPVWVTTRSSS